MSSVRDLKRKSISSVASSEKEKAVFQSLDPCPPTRCGKKSGILLVMKQ